MAITRFRTADRRRRGGALIIMVLCILGLAALAAGLMHIGLDRAKDERARQQDLHADYVCEAGLSQSMYQLQRGMPGDVGTQGAPTAWGAGRFWVQATNVTPDVIRLTATGTDNTTGSRQELVVRAVPNTIWRYGAFGHDYLYMDSNARVDSYNSSAGSYAAQAVNGSGSDQHAASNGHIGSNGDVSLDQNAIVWGNATAGPSHSTTVLGNAQVTGTTTPAAEQMQLPVLNVPSYPSLGNLTVNANSTLASGNYNYGNLIINSTKTLTITGPANIVCSNLRVRSNSSLLVDATNGPVTWYVIDNFVLDANAVIRSTNYIPADVRLNLLSDNVIDPGVNVHLDDVDFESNSAIHGTVFAPHARVILNSNFQMFGAIIARSVDVNSNARFHFDEALMNATANGIPIYETVCWRELPYQQ